METQPQKTTLSKKLLYIAIPSFILLLTWFALQIKQKYFPPKPIHYHAGFKVIKDNQQVDFTDIKYMHAKPCGKEEHEETTPEEEQIEKAHLHDYIGDVVHFHRKNVKWKDLFLNLKYSLPKPEAYLNGQKTPDFLNQTIKPYDSLIVFIGNHNDIQKHLKQTVTKTHIQQIEKKSDNCGS